MCVNGVTIFLGYYCMHIAIGIFRVIFALTCNCFSTSDLICVRGEHAFAFMFVFVFVCPLQCPNVSQGN